MQESISPGKQHVFRLAWPIALNGLLLQAVVLIDTLIVAPLGERAIAAMGLANAVGGLCIGVLFALFNGTQVLMAQQHGAKNLSSMRTLFWTGLSAGLLVVASCALLVFNLSAQLLAVFADDVSVREIASRYLLAFLPGLLGMCLSQHFTVILYAIGQSRPSFYSTIIETPVNIAISIVLVYGLWGLPELGVIGAAIGTSVAAWMRAALLFMVFSRYHTTLMSWPGWSRAMYWQKMMSYLAQALPVAGSLLCITLAQSACLLLYARLGVTAYAVLTLVTTWTKFGAQFVTPWAQATGILVGQLLGRHQGVAATQLVSISWRIILMGGLCLSACYWLATLTINVTYPSLQIPTIKTLESLLPLLVLLPLIRTSNTLCGHVLRSAGNGTFTFYTNLASSWGFLVPMSFLAIVIWDWPVFWVFLIVLLDEIIKSIPLHWRMHRGHWQRASAVI